ncbi:MAG: type II toxin-antitoxin system PemK/MazF family toxin [Beijerinckiaceae bacterium]
MAFPDPQPGLVIRYAYLWRSEAERDREEGGKDRPCAVVLATKRGPEGKTTVVVAPITHSPPQDPKTAIEIPDAMKARLGLDDTRSWIVTNDLNYFVWPGSDVRPVNPRKPEQGIAYGYLSQHITQRLISEVRDRMREGQTKAVPRDAPER